MNEVTIMTQLLTQVKENVSFVLMCIVIVTALSLLSKFAEKFFPQKRAVAHARRITNIAICSAIATVLHVMDFPLLFIAPEFYKLDFSELPVLLCGFYLGPSAAVTCEGVKILLKLLVKGTSTEKFTHENRSYSKLVLKASTVRERLLCT